jgi:hypothetical protein
MRALLFLLFFLSLTPFTFAVEENAGIVQGIWYADEEVFVDRPTRVYVAVRNNTGSDLTGTIEFYDGDKKLGRKSIQALNGHIVESWTDWNASYGNHTLKATLSRIELHKVGETEEEVEVTSAIAEDALFVDYDTDKDGIGNETDTDDDNDQKSDESEQRDGTDPLKSDTPRAEESSSNENEDDQSHAPSTDGTGSDENADGSTPLGVERYLGDGRVHETVSNITSVINDTKVKIDEYRKERKEKQETKKVESETYQSGFGTTTSSTGEGQAIDEWSLSDFFAVVFDLFKTIFSWVYTLVLAIISFTLGYPMLVQVGVLLLILILLFKTAAKFGRRRQRKI